LRKASRRYRWLRRGVAVQGNV